MTKRNDAQIVGSNEPDIKVIDLDTFKEDEGVEVEPLPHDIVPDGAPESAPPSDEVTAPQTGKTDTSTESSGLGPIFPFRKLWEWVRQHGLRTESYLPFLGQDGYIRKGGSHLLSAFPKSGKSTLLFHLVTVDWHDQPVLYLSEESEEVWAFRAKQMIDRELEPEDNLTVVNVRGFGVVQFTEVAVRLMEGKKEWIVVVDTIRDVLGIEDENDNAKVGAALKAFIAAAQRHQQTLVLVHHSSKASAGKSTGDGRSVAGAHAFVGTVDVVLELKEGHQVVERRIQGKSRFGEIEPLTSRKD